MGFGTLGKKRSQAGTDWHAISPVLDIILGTLVIFSHKRFQLDGFGLGRVLWPVPLHASQYDDGRKPANESYSQHENR
jgi:hypothetical protein